LLNTDELKYKEQGDEDIDTFEDFIMNSPGYLYFMAILNSYLQGHLILRVFHYFGKKKFEVRRKSLKEYKD
jgi:hypothetical protein